MRVLLMACFAIMTSFAVWAQNSPTGDAVAGKQKSATCVACHMADGNSVNPQWPKIAGQSRQYIVKQLKLFKDKVRVNPLMNPQAISLSDQDMQDLGAYFESQKPSKATASKEHVALGEKIYRGGNPATGVPACLSCHGPNGVGNPAAGFPRLSHQHSAYTEQRLKAYRKGTNYPGAEIMAGVAKQMTDSQIKAVSEYIQGLH